MSTQPQDGGPAFPVNDFVFPNGQVVVGSNGMTLRDYFASQVIQGLYSRIPWGSLTDIRPSEMAENAYEVADAMLAKRAKGGK